MGHMDDDDDRPSTITVHWGISAQSQSETFHGCTKVEHDEHELNFEDSNGKYHHFSGVTYHIAEE